VATAVVVALSEDSALDARAVLLWLVVTMLVFWLAHAYADVIAAQLGRDTPSLAVQVGHSMRREWPIAQAAGVPGVALVLGWAGLLSNETAINLAIALGVMQLALWGFAISRSKRLTLLGTLAVTGVSSAFGLALVGLKVLVH